MHRFCHHWKEKAKSFENQEFLRVIPKDIKMLKRRRRRSKRSYFFSINEKGSEMGSESPSKRIYSRNEHKVKFTDSAADSHLDVGSNASPNLKNGKLEITVNMFI